MYRTIVVRAGPGRAWRLWPRRVAGQSGTSRRKRGAVAPRGSCFAMNINVTEPAAADAIDLRMMQRCIELSRIAARLGEMPFAALISKDGKIVAEATNRVARDADVTRHAELMA